MVEVKEVDPLVEALSSLEAHKESVLTNIHEAIMDLQTMGFHETNENTKAEISKFERELVNVCQRFRAFCGDTALQIQVEILERKEAP